MNGLLFHMSPSTIESSRIEFGMSHYNTVNPTSRASYQLSCLVPKG